MFNDLGDFTFVSLPLPHFSSCRAQTRDKARQSELKLHSEPIAAHTEPFPFSLSRFDARRNTHP